MLGEHDMQSISSSTVTMGFFYKNIFSTYTFKLMLQNYTYQTEDIITVLSSTCSIYNEGKFIYLVQIFKKPYTNNIYLNKRSWNDLDAHHDMI